MALCLLAMGCGDDTVASSVQCETNTDCYEGCFGYDSVVCSAEGRCYCNDIQEDRGCDLDTDCTEGCTDYDTHTCSGGMCVCSNTLSQEECSFIDRAEFVTAVISAIDGLADYQAPTTPTFDDVPTDAPFYHYVEAAVQLGIVSGYTDAAGNLTGMFGPYDTVNRAAMIKIVVNAFAVPTTLSPASPFPDVPTSTWFHNYVLTAYNQGLFTSSADGLFHPAETATNCFMNEVLWRATTLPEDPVVYPNSSLEVSLNSDTPPSSTLPKAATNVHLASFDFTGYNETVYVQDLVITRGGVGNSNDWDYLYLYYSDGNPIALGFRINEATNTVTFPSGPLSEVDTTKTVHLIGDVSDAAIAGNQHYFYIATPADIISNAVAVSGDFPVVGNTFTVSNVSVGTATISAGSRPVNPQINSQDAELAAFQLLCTPNDCAIHEIVLNQGGSLQSSKLQNLRLLRGTDEVAATPYFEGDQLRFVLSAPYVAPADQTKHFYVRGDIVGGQAEETIQLYLSWRSSLQVIDQQYGYGSDVVNSFGETEAHTLTLQ